jgi:hypothetical protein
MSRQHVLQLLTMPVFMAVIVIARHINSTRTWVDVVAMTAMVATGALAVLALQ